MMYALKFTDDPQDDSVGYPTENQIIPAGMSTDEIDMGEFIKRLICGKCPSYQNIGDFFEIDWSSIQPRFGVKNETSSIQENVEKTTPLPLSEENIVMGMVDHDIITGLPPKRRYKVELKIRNIRRGKPKIVDPEVF